MLFFTFETAFDTFRILEIALATLELITIVSLDSIISLVFTQGKNLYGYNKIAKMMITGRKILNP